MSEKNLCHVTVVLLCMGRGGDPNAYRPNRDESQWWSRRDALVRCVASFLFGPSSAASKSMILIFDDDRAKMYLSSSGSAGSAVPTEQTILSLFKHAAQSLNSTVWKDGLSCRIVIDPTLTKDSKGKSNCCPGLPNGLDSKRELLEYLQQNCSIDFLRTNGLNSNPKVILRKTNKKALMDIWGNWRRQHNSEKGQGSIKKEFSDETAIESLYSEILTEFQQECANQNPIVGILHETCIEFPCFGWGKEDNEVHNDKKLRVLMFLGAVRDMTKQENKILEDVCQRLDIPLVGVRFGTVPEFTSKILSILALHNSHPSTLKCTMKCLLDDAGRRASCLVSPPRRTHTSLHIICVVPMTTQDLSLALEQRDRRHWCIIRVVVCTLWRSRLVSSDISSKVGHVNTLTFVFDDGVTLYLTEEAFVSKLASQHQAAPSEYQILAAIQTLLDSKPSPPKNSSKKVLASEIVDQVIQSSPEPITATISINPAAESGIWQQFYTAEGASKNTPLSHSSIIAILDIQGESFFGEGTTSKIRKMHRAIVRAAEKQNLLIYHDSVVMGNEDYEASCIICLQHMLYQNRFFTNSSTLSGKKRMNLHIQPTRSLTDHSSK